MIDKWSLNLIILLALILSIGIAHADDSQEIGVRVYKDLSSEVLSASAAVSKNIKTLIKLNRNSVDDVKYPKELKDAIDGKLKVLIASYTSALQEALDTNKKIAGKEQMELCVNQYEKFKRQVLLPLNSDVEAYASLDVEAGDKSVAIFGLASDLSIQCGMSTSELVMGPLNHCLMIID